MKVAYFGFPHFGGTFQVFRHLRAGLLPSGIEVQWVGLGAGAHRSLSDPAWAAEASSGFVVGSLRGPDEVWARQTVAALKAGRFDAVFINVLADAVQTNVARYLPRELRRIMIVHSITPGTYAAARAIRDHVHATVAISPRVSRDLQRRHGFAPARIVTIPHAVDVSEGLAPRRAHSNEMLRLLYLGRVEDKSKGVLLLPRILSRLPGVTLTVAGDGPDLQRLRQLSEGLGDRARFLGAVHQDVATALLAQHDILVMPSRFEGFGLTLIEAMAAGCVPVVSRIQGVTDWIVRDGVDAVLFPVGNVARAAEGIASLGRDPALLERMSRAGMRAAREQFGRDRMASRYADLLRGLELDAPEIAAPLDLARWEMPPGLRDSIRTRIPTPLKNLLRRANEHLCAARWGLAGPPVISALNDVVHLGIV